MNNNQFLSSENSDFEDETMTKCSDNEKECCLFKPRYFSREFIQCLDEGLYDTLDYLLFISPPRCLKKFFEKEASYILRWSIMAYPSESLRRLVKLMPRKMLLQELKQSDYSIVRSQIQVIKSVFQEEQTTEETKQDYYKKWKILYSLKNKKLQKVIREEMDWINIDELFN
jgi:hypothetical protein